MLEIINNSIKTYDDYSLSFIKMFKFHGLLSLSLHFKKFVLNLFKRLCMLSFKLKKLSYEQATRLDKLDLSLRVRFKAFQWTGLFGEPMLYVQKKRISGFVEGFVFDLL